MKRRHFLILLAGTSTLTSCGDMAKAKGLADAAMAGFHHQFNDAKFKEIHAGADPTFKATVTEADLIKLLEAIHRKLGKQVRSAETGWRVNTFNLKTTAVVTLDTEFERGKGVETFTFVISGASCGLQSYYINSPDMMTQ